MARRAPKCWRIRGRKLVGSRRYYTKKEALKGARSLARLHGKRKPYRVSRAACLQR